ncbi:uncharacterized protein Dwil_GK12488 [Drosophila willistoni]|uniref:Amino acid transporter transmembrane domain-containing protein n=2 Tax=Drosophila willistoni TaxID=7260 RepID=B4N3C5_DROWI|nr:uncharacterized protein Dwil_GK12488 [Drosophila willistoni]
MVDLVLALSHYGVAVVYILFVAKNVQQLIHYHFSYYSLEIFVAVVGILLLPLFMVRQLKYLVPLNVLSNVLMYMGFLLIFYYLFRGLPSMSDRKMIGAFDELLEFFGIVFFAVTSVGVMLAIESKMATPEKYIGCFGILNIAAVIVVFSNLLFGVLGFWRYGDEIRSSVTLNLPSDTVVSQISKISIALGVFMTYPLSGYVTIDIIIREWVLKGRSYPHPHMIEYIVRVLFVFLSTINAMAFPKLSPLVALVGSVTISVLNLIFPAFIEMSLLYSNSYGRLKWILVKDILLVILGFSILVHGLYSGTRTMLRTYHPDYQDNQKCLNVSTKSTCQIDDL